MTSTSLPPAEPQAVTAAAPMWVAGRRFDRLLVRTPWLVPPKRLADALATYVARVLQPGDTVAVSEKVAVLLTGRTVPIHTVDPGRLAQLLVRFVRPPAGEKGLAVPEKMQYVLNHTGRTRVLSAAAVSACTRPFGVRGTFYRVAGSLARDIDGGRPPHESLIFPPLPRAEATALAEELQDSLGGGVGVAIVDINNFGGSVRSTSSAALPAALLMAILADNPQGQRSSKTPFVVVRPST